MFAVIKVVPLKSGEKQQFIEEWQKIVLPLMQQHPGFSGVTLLDTPQQDEVVFILKWESPEAAKAWQNNPQHKTVHPKITARWAGKPTKKPYKICLDT